MSDELNQAKFEMGLHQAVDVLNDQASMDAMAQAVIWAKVAVCKFTEAGAPSVTASGMVMGTLHKTLLALEIQAAGTTIPDGIDRPSQDPNF